MDLEKVWMITRKDLAEIRKNKMILYVMIILPVFFATVFPASTVLGLQDEDITIEDFAILISLITSGFIPIFIILPAAIPNVIASYSFVGEKTEKTLEPLLATPITDNELLTGKLLASFIPGVLITILAFLLFTVIIDVLSYGQLGYLLLPNAVWMVSIFVLGPLVAIGSIMVTIIFSSRMNDPRAIQQMSVLVMLPILGLFFGSVSQVLVFDMGVLLIVIAAFAVADWSMFSLARRLFEREAILTKWK
jgi:ABC-2 type transport system permease protein